MHRTGRAGREVRDSMTRLLTVAGLVACLTVIPMSAASASDIVELKKCPPGYEGIVIGVDGRYISVCQNILP